MTETFDRATYPYWTTVPTRWNDNDQFGHVNNTVHYGIMDTTINDWLKAHGFDVAAGGDTINLTPETGCRYLAEISYPDAFEVGLRVVHIGRTSVRWECGLARASDGVPVAIATMAHVFVDVATRHPREVPAALRESMAALVVDGSAPVHHDVAEGG